MISIEDRLRRTEREVNSYAEQKWSQKFDLFAARIDFTDIITEIYRICMKDDNRDHFSVMITQDSSFTGFRWIKKFSNGRTIEKHAHFFFKRFSLYVFLIVKGEACTFEKTGDGGFINWRFNTDHAIRDGNFVHFH
jgi:hypothetical protein